MDPSKRKYLKLVLVACGLVTLYRIAKEFQTIVQTVSTPMTNQTHNSATEQFERPSSEEFIIASTQSQIQITACIFTSFKDNPKKEKVYNNTIKNWSRFLPDIQPVLLSTNMSGHMTSVAEAYGWIVKPCPRTNEFGTPVLKDMYLKAYTLVNASLYGFSNGDILFDNGLLKTLRVVSEKQVPLNTSLIIGRRWHHKLRKEEDLGEFSLTDITKLANTNVSQNCSGIAEDFFFVNKQYPWHQIKDVVIGRPAYDNYIVARSIKLNVSTVDVTKTVSAIHQVGHDGKFAGFHMKDSNYNHKVIGWFDHRKGNADHSWFRTHYDFSGQVIIMNHKVPPMMISKYAT